MIIQPKREERNVNDMFYASEKARIEKLNECFFADIDLTKDENRVLVWLCGWDWYTHNNIVSAFAPFRVGLSYRKKIESRTWMT